MTAQQQYILALDYGAQRVGVAIAHITARLPRPLTTLANGQRGVGTDAAGQADHSQLMSKIQQLVQDQAAGLVVVGLPRGMDGGYTAQTRAAEAFARALSDALDVPVELADETLTSVDAEALLGPGPHAKGDIDAAAAALILERYLAEHPAAPDGATGAAPDSDDAGAAPHRYGGGTAA